MDVLGAFHRNNASYLHVVDAKGVLAGIISFRDLRNVLAEEYLEHLIIARDIATTCLQTVQANDSIQHALHTMAVRGISQLPVIDESGRLQGTIRERDVVTAYDKAVVQRQLTQR
jgi:CIC family chloride channel protein